LLGEAELQENAQRFKNFDTPILSQTYHLPPRGSVQEETQKPRELEKYLGMSFPATFYFEVNRDWITRLKEKAAACTGVRVFSAHVAITDHHGKMTLRVTSMDQSSAIPSLGIHKNIAPSIRECTQIDVPARTLDHLVYELGLSPNLFNSLNLDILGIKLLVLKGAARVPYNAEMTVWARFQMDKTVRRFEKLLGKKA